MPVRKRRTTRRTTSRGGSKASLSRSRRVTRRRRPLRGSGWMGDAWKLVKSRVKSIIPSWDTIKSEGLKYARNNKLLSTATRRLTNDSIGDWVHAKTGYGRRRRVTRRRTTRRRTLRGRGFFDDLWSGVKNTANAVLPAISTIGQKMLLKKFGAGRRRRTVRRKTTRRRTLRGGSNWVLPRLNNYRYHPKPALQGGRRRTLRGRGVLSSILSQFLPF